MKQTITQEIPDLEILPERFTSDIMKVYVRDNKIVFVVEVDNAGNEFEITKKELKELLR